MAAVLTSPTTLWRLSWPTTIDLILTLAVPPDALVVLAPALIQPRIPPLASVLLTQSAGRLGHDRRCVGDHPVLGAPAAHGAGHATAHLAAGGWPCRC